MSYNAIITKLHNVRPHSNADKVKLATVVGNQVVIGLEHEEGELGIYFPTDGQLSHEFCSENNLYRDSSLNKDKDSKPGMFDDNRRVRTQKFRGEVSDGFWVPLSLLNFINTWNWEMLFEGTELSEFGGVPICNKYLTKSTKDAAQNQSKKQKRAKSSIMFKEHYDTEHFGKNLNKFKIGDQLVITEKIHGTSGRIGYVLVDKKLNWKERLAKYLGIAVQEQKWDYLNGSRRVVIEESSGTQFHDPTIRDYAFNLFKGNLHKGETVFFEIIGFEPDGKAIMPSVNTKALKDKEFTEKYGETMHYSYGCEIGQCKVRIYRITNTNEDGKTIDLSWEDIKTRCGEIGVEHVPELGLLELTSTKSDYGESISESHQEKLLSNVEELVKGESLLDPSHIREGVVIRIEGNNLTPQVFKHKSYEFKVLEGIVKDTGVVDEEELQSETM